jgi:hypothetical protein
MRLAVHRVEPVERPVERGAVAAAHRVADRPGRLDDVVVPAVVVAVVVAVELVVVVAADVLGIGAAGPGRSWRPRGSAHPTRAIPVHRIDVHTSPPTSRSQARLRRRKTLPGRALTSVE